MSDAKTDVIMASVDEEAARAAYERMNEQAEASGDVGFGTVEEMERLFRLGREISKSSMIPEKFQGNPMNCAIALDMAKRTGLSPMTVMSGMYFIDGAPAWNGVTSMAIIKSCGKFTDINYVYTGDWESFESMISEDEPETDAGCYVSARIKETGKVVRGTEISISMAVKEGWYSKKNEIGEEVSKWRTMPRQLIAYRAATFFARMYCPDSLSGIPVECEVEDIRNEPADYIDPLGGGGGSNGEKETVPDIQDFL